MWNISSMREELADPIHRPTKSETVCMFQLVPLILVLILSRSWIQCLFISCTESNHTVGNSWVVKLFFLSSKYSGWNHSNSEWYKPKVIFVRVRIAFASSPEKQGEKPIDDYVRTVGLSPSKSRLGPTSIAFQLNAYFDGQSANPSWCYSKNLDRSEK